jgi:phosphoadenosine phosphosulfate reductase
MNDEPIWRNGGFVADEWTRYSAEAGLPPAGQPLLVPFAAFTAEPERFVGYSGPLGVEVAAGEAVGKLEPYLWRLSLVSLIFPKFHDGRSYSAARLLRERYAYKGELRASGDVLSDQIQLMRRCGMSSFEVSHGPTRAALAAGHLAEMRHFYQSMPNAPEAPAGARPWVRQPAVRREQSSA